MEIGEIVGILFIIGIIALVARYVYSGYCCPGCGSFRSIKTVEVKYTAIDDEVDVKDVIWHFVTEGEHRGRKTQMKWVDRCKECGIETKGEGVYKHY